MSRFFAPPEKRPEAPKPGASCQSRQASPEQARTQQPARLDIPPLLARVRTSFSEYSGHDGSVDGMRQRDGLGEMAEDRRRYFGLTENAARSQQVDGSFPLQTGIPPLLVRQGVSTSPGLYRSTEMAEDRRRYFGLEDLAPGEHQTADPSPNQHTLRVGREDDPCEQDADRTADALVRMPGMAFRAGNVASSPSPSWERQRSASLHRRAAPGGETPTSAPPIVHEVLRSSGQPMDDTTRAAFEPKLGLDFSQVRIHTDETAARSAQAVGASAYTIGADVVFGAGQYRPHTLAGQRLLAHELAHVGQQTRGGASGSVLQRQVAPGLARDDASSALVAGSISPQYAKALNADELEYDISLLLARIDSTPAGTPEHEALRANLEVLEVEAQRRGHRSAALAEHAIRTGVAQLVPEMRQAVTSLQRMSGNVDADILAHDRERATNHLGRIVEVLQETVTTVNLAVTAPRTVRPELVRLAGVRVQAAMFAMYALSAGMAYLEVSHQLAGHPYVSAESLLVTTWRAWDRVDVVINQLCTLTDAAVEKGALAALELVPRLADELEAYIREIERGVRRVGKIILVASIIETVTSLATMMRSFGPRGPIGLGPVGVPAAVMGVRGGVAVVGQVAVSVEWLEMIRRLVQIGALSSTAAAGAIKASGINMATGIGDDPKATADKLAKEPQPKAPAPAEPKPAGWGPHDDEIAEHAMKHFPGKTKDQVIQLIRDVRTNMDRYVAGNGKVLWRKGNLIVIDDPTSTTGFGTIFSPDNIRRFLKQFILDNPP